MKKREIFLVLIVVFILILVSTQFFMEKPKLAPGPHPYLFFNSQDIPALKAKWNDPQYSEIVNLIKDKVELSILAPSNPDPLPYSEWRVSVNTRGYETDLTNLAFYYLMEDDPVALEKAIDYIEAMVYEYQWLDTPNNVLTRAQYAIGLSTAYDWLYDDLNATLRAGIEAKLLQEMGSNSVGPYYGEYYKWTQPVNVQFLNYYTDNAYQNIAWITLSGLGISSYALQDVYPVETSLWKARVESELAWRFPALGPEGISHEGIGYLTYGFSYPIYLFEVRNRVDGIAYPNVDAFKNIDNFLVHTTMPDGFRNYVYADYFGNDNGKPHLPNTMQVLAFASSRYNKVYGNTLYEQWIPNTQEWMVAPQQFIFYNASLPQQPISSNPTYAFFNDTGIVTFRSGWDKNASLVAFKSGWYGGIFASLYHLSNNVVLSSGHEHQDQNSFVYWANNELLLKDYPNKLTTNTPGHNTITVGRVDNYSQRFWTVLANPPLDTLVNQYISSNDRPIINVTDDYYYTTGDAHLIYSSGSGLQKYRRHILFPKNYVIIFDQVELDDAVPVNWYFHTDHSIVDTVKGFRIDAVNQTMYADVYNLGTYNETINTTMPGNSEAIKITKEAQNIYPVFILHNDKQPITVNKFSFSDPIINIEIQDGADTHFIRFNKDTDAFAFSSNCVDNDGDGYNGQGANCGTLDFNDNDKFLFPNAPEWCDGRDNNNDGRIDYISTQGDLCGREDCYSNICKLIVNWLVLYNGQYDSVLNKYDLLISNSQNANIGDNINPLFVTHRAFTEALDYPGPYYEWSTINANENWFVHNSSGGRMRNNLFSRAWLMNLTQQSYLDFQSDIADTVTAYNGLDGWFWDNYVAWNNLDDFLMYWYGIDSSYIYSSQTQYESALNNSAYQLKRSTGNKLSLTNNLADENGFVKYFDGYASENWVHSSSHNGWPAGEYTETNWTQDMDAATNPIHQNKLLLLLCGNSVNNPDVLDFCFASYLLAKQPNVKTYFGFFTAVPGEVPMYHNIYDIDLGAPTNNYQKVDPSGLYRRNFERGTVLVNPTDNPGVINYNLGGTYTNLSGNSVSSVSLAKHQVAILFSTLGCGNGIIEGTEQCDDQNVNMNDGCSGSCVIETGWTCTGEPSSCSPICGDGLILGDELCDGNNQLCTGGEYNGIKTCNAQCTGFNPCAITESCGDNLVNGLEQCDGIDLNEQVCTTLGYDFGVLSCDSSCQFDTSACALAQICGNGIVEGTEQCDSSDLNGQSCTSLGYDSGVLGCSIACSFDINLCVQDVGSSPLIFKGSSPLIFKGSGDDDEEEIVPPQIIIPDENEVTELEEIVISLIDVNYKEATISTGGYKLQLLGAVNHTLELNEVNEGSIILNIDGDIHEIYLGTSQIVYLDDYSLTIRYLEYTSEGAKISLEKDLITIFPEFKYYYILFASLVGFTVILMIIASMLRNRKNNKI